MTNRQYEQLLQNRGRRKLRPLFTGVAEGRLLRAAVRSVRQRAAAEQVLERVLPSELLQAASIVALDQGTLTVGVSGSVERAQLRRSIGRLRKQLVGVVPGLRQVRVTATPRVEAQRS
jgi:Rod binding domain-containing protein